MLHLQVDSSRNKRMHLLQTNHLQFMQFRSQKDRQPKVSLMWRIAPPLLSLQKDEREDWKLDWNTCLRERVWRPQARWPIESGITLSNNFNWGEDENFWAEQAHQGGLSYEQSLQRLPCVFQISRRLSPAFKNGLPSRPDYMQRVRQNFQEKSI